MLHGHIDSSLLYLYATIKLSATATSQVIVKYVLETNNFTNLGTYAT